MSVLCTIDDRAMRMTEYHRIFKVEREDNSLIVLPHGDSLGFRYADMHREANKVLQVIRELDAQHLVIDLGHLDYAGSELIGALIRFAKTVSDNDGRAVLCNASEKMLQVLSNMKLNKLWPYFETRTEALQAVRDES